MQSTPSPADRVARRAVALAFATQGLVFISLTTRLPRFSDRWHLSEVELSLVLLMIVLLAGAGSVVCELVAHRSYRGCPFRNHLRETRDVTDPAGRFALAQVRALRMRIGGLARTHAEAERIWLLLEGVYAAAPYPERARMAKAAVAYVEELALA